MIVVAVGDDHMGDACGVNASHLEAWANFGGLSLAAISGRIAGVDQHRNPGAADMQGVHGEVRDAVWNSLRLGREPVAQAVGYLAQRQHRCGERADPDLLDGPTGHPSTAMRYRRA